ncbi:hypothetical protein ABZ807_21770 [Micromonospora sp. NPDC047548]|uniref:hypothetical protein n=1 Tax=Micromonospora sp. NPDC047548 TaxID=3155624 RepID=UPI0033DC2365
MTAADPTSAFTAAQRAAGVIAAKHRGDLDGAEQLLATFPDDGSAHRRRHRTAAVPVDAVSSAQPALTHAG